MKKGFTLIEVVVAIFLASLISLSLYRLLNQVQRAVRRITNIIGVDTPLSGFFNQVEKDLTGMFTPYSALEVFIEQDKKKAEQKGDKDSQKKEVTQLTQPIQDVFILNGQKGQFFMSWISTGGIQVLDATGKITPVPLVRRVAYLLEEDPQRPGTSRLMYRFSGTNLDLAPIKSADFTPSYELLNNIKDFFVEVSVLALTEKPTDTQKKEPEIKNREDTGAVKATVTPSRTITLTTWNPQEVWDKYKTLIPAYVKLSGIRVDFEGREYPFEVVAKVYAYSPYVAKEKSLFEALEDIAASIWKTK